MISGTVSANREAVVPLRLITAAGQTVDIDAVVDTGFTGSLTLPGALIGLLGCAFRSRQQIMLGDGSLVLVDVFVGAVLWHGQHHAIEIDSAETDPLIGMSLLYGSELRVQVVDGGSVAIEALP
jgi:clan AA aspartic protease